MFLMCRNRLIHFSILKWCRQFILTFYLPIATKRQVDGKAKNVFHKILERAEKTLHLLFRNSETQEHTHCHVEGEPLGLTINIDGVRVGAPHPHGLLNDQLDLGQVALQSLMTEDFSKDLGNTIENAVSLLCSGVSPTENQFDMINSFAFRIENFCIENSLRRWEFYKCIAASPKTSSS